MESEIIITGGNNMKERSNRNMFILLMFLFCLSSSLVYAAGDQNAEFDTQHSPMKGPANAPVELVVFTNFE